MVNKILFSSTTDDWGTPSNIYDYYNNLGYTDPCPLNGTGGLDSAWEGPMFINPPYSNLKEWVDYGVTQNNPQVWLVPSRTDTKWFHKLMVKTAEIFFIKGRLKFGGSKNSAPFPSCLIITKFPIQIPEINGIRTEVFNPCIQ